MYSEQKIKFQNASKTNNGKKERQKQIAKKRETYLECYLPLKKATDVLLDYDGACTQQEKALSSNEHAQSLLNDQSRFARDQDALLFEMLVELFAQKYLSNRKAISI